MKKLALILAISSIFVLPSFAQESLKEKVFAKGPEFESRKQLYKLILTAKEQGIGISGFLNYFNSIEKKVESGADDSTIKKEIQRIKDGLVKLSVKGADDLAVDSGAKANKKIPDYVNSLESLFQEKVPSLGTQKKQLTIAMKIQTTEGPFELRTKQNDSVSSALCKKFEAALKSLPNLPAPPKAFFPVDVVFGKNGKVASVSYSGNKQKAKAVEAPSIDPRFFARVVRKLQSNWKNIPSYSGKSVYFEFRLTNDGNVKDLKITRSSGIKYMDQLAIYTVKKSSPFAPCPKGIEKVKIKHSFTNYLK